MNRLLEIMKKNGFLKKEEGVIDTLPITEETLQVIQTVSKCLYDHLIDETDASIAFRWEIENNQPKLTDLSMGIPFKIFRKEVPLSLMEGFEALCELESFNVYPTVDHNQIEKGFDLECEWIINCVIALTLKSERYYEDHLQFIMKYKKLAPKLATSYRSYRYATRLHGEEMSETQIERTKRFAYTLGRSIAVQLNERYNIERQRLITQCKHLLWDLSKKYHLYNFLNESINDCSFYQYDRGFRVIEENPLFIHEFNIFEKKLNK